MPSDADPDPALDQALRGEDIHNDVVKAIVDLLMEELECITEKETSESETGIPESDTIGQQTTEIHTEANSKDATKIIEQLQVSKLCAHLYFTKLSFFFANDACGKKKLVTQVIYIFFVLYIFYTFYGGTREAFYK